MNDTALLAASRQAYERGRIRKGARRALAVLPVSLLPLYQCMTAGRGAQMLAVIAVLVTLVAIFHWRGQGYARGANVGLIAGMSPLLLPVLASWIVPMCSTALCAYLPWASVAGGFLGALSLAGGGLAREERTSIAFWFAAISVTVALGAAGCLHIGLAGLGGLAFGLTAGTLPVVALYTFKAR